MPNKKELFLICAPEIVDRGTEQHFSDLFEGRVRLIYEGYSNHEPHADCVLLFEGGTDISSAMYGETPGPNTQAPDIRRDNHETAFFHKALAVGAPMIGVCRGAQLLCALSGGHIIQHVSGHHTRHKIQLPKCFGRQSIFATSAHHQMMNPYVLPHKDWVSCAHATWPQSGKYYGEIGKKLKLHKTYPLFQEQEIVWFPKTKSLAIQGHPEYYANKEELFVQYCRFLINTLILGVKTQYDIQAT